MTRTPNRFQRFFGAKEVIERYRTLGEYFEYFSHLKVFYKENGEMMHATSKECELLNNFSRSF